MRTLGWLLLVSIAAACSSSPASLPDASRTPAAPVTPPPVTDRAVPPLPQPEFLAHVPADTPFFFGALSPLPLDYVEREYLARLAAYEKVRPAMERLRRKRPREMKRIGFLIRLEVALLGELGGAATAGKLAALGLDPSTVGALYGLGMNPVVRIRLSDPARFASVLGRMATRLEPIERAELKGQRYYAAREDGVLWIIAVAGPDLVVALIPPAQRAALLPLLFGQTRPPRSMAGDGRLPALAAAYGFSPAGVGFADFTRMAAELGATLPEPCAAELGQMAAAVSRVAVGLASASGQEVRVRSVLETRADVASQLLALRGEVPRADPSGAAVAPIELSAAVDMTALVTWVSGILDHIKTTPFRCAALEWMNDMAKSQDATVRQAGRAMANVRGASVAVRQIEGLVIGTADFFVLFGSDRPAELLGRLAGALGVTAPALRPGDPPAELPSPLGSMFGKVYVALGQRAVGLSVGAEPAELLDVISGDVVDDPPLLLLRLDPKALGELQRLGGTSVDSRIAALDQQLAADLAEIEQGEMERFDQMVITVRAMPRGLAVDLHGRYPR
jgi:hypothetical protein